MLVKQIKSLLFFFGKNTSDYCDNLRMPIRIVTKAPIVNEGLMYDDAENATAPVLQLFADVQHDVAVPDADEPALEAVHVVPDGTHEYVLVAQPANQTEEV
jgi:hypothetical protein